MNTKARLTRSYLLSLILFLLVFLVGQLLFRSFLNEQESDSKVINLSGRQRMLSQKISKATLKVMQAETPKEWEAGQRELENALQLLSSTHMNLTEQSHDLGLSINNGNTTQKLYTLLEPHYQAIYRQASSIVGLDFNKASQDSSARKELLAASKEILMHEKEFLPIMDTIVHIYDEESKGRIDSLSLLEWAVMGVGIIVAFLSALLIFRPMVHKVVQSEQAIQQQNEEMKATEEELRQNMEELAVTQDNLSSAYNQAQSQLTAINSTVGYVEISPKKILIDANSRFANWLGYDKDDLIGTAHFELIPNIQEQKEAYEAFWDKLSLGKTVTSVFGRKHKEGHIVWLFASYTPVYGSDGKLLKVVKIATDFSKQKEAEEALKNTNSQLRATEEELRQNTEEIMAVNDRLTEEKRKTEEAMNKFREAQTQLIQAEKMSSLGQLTAGIAHEINNPVNFIAAGTQTLRILVHDIFDFFSTYQRLEQKATEAAIEPLSIELGEIREKSEAVGGAQELQHDVEAMIRDVETGVDRVVEVVRGLKNFSRSDEGSRSMADLHESLDATLLILNNKHKNRIEILKEYDANLPQIECYAGQIGQVFMNILSNAMDAIEDRGSIRIQTRNLDDSIEIKISDTGKGMPEDVRNRIFDPFFTTKPTGKGTGLGMSISHGIIEKHNGSISVDSRLNEGTSFTIEIPKKLMEETEALA